MRKSGEVETTTSTRYEFSGAEILKILSMPDGARVFVEDRLAGEVEIDDDCPVVVTVVETTRKEIT